MKYLAPVLVIYALFKFTAPEGSELWVMREQTVAVTHVAPGQCDDRAHSRIVTTKYDVCVRESVQQVVDKLNDTQ